MGIGKCMNFQMHDLDTLYLCYICLYLIVTLVLGDMNTSLDISHLTYIHVYDMHDKRDH